MARSNAFWKLATLLSFGALAAAVSMLYRQRLSHTGATAVLPAGKQHREAALDRGVRSNRTDKPIVIDISEFDPMPDPDVELGSQSEQPMPKAAAVARHSDFPVPKFNEHHHHH